MLIPVGCCQSHAETAKTGRDSRIRCRADITGLPAGSIKSRTAAVPIYPQMEGNSLIAAVTPESENRNSNFVPRLDSPFTIIERPAFIA